MQPPHPRPAIYLDRDGTLVEEVDYRVDPGQVRRIPGAAAAVRRLNQAGWPVVIVTNQSMIARGMANERQLVRIHARLTELLSAEGARLDGIYYCPHHPELGEPPYRAACDCRKPLPGLLRQAARELDLDLAQSAMIGDSLRDLAAGQAAGCRQLVLVRTGHGRAEETKVREADLGISAAICDDFAAAVVHLLSPDQRARSFAGPSVRSQSRPA
jgi:D-glycero-D-manno-heptose 1,7-bisphosphate phosphatase